MIKTVRRYFPRATEKGYTVDITRSIFKPIYPRSEGLVQNSMWINDLFLPQADGYDQHIVLFQRLSLLPFIEQGLETISFLIPHAALGWFAASQSCSYYLTLVAWNNLPASGVVSDKASTFKNHWADHPMRHAFLASRPGAFSE